ncbi:hypothetical protein Bcep1808_2020 [Burkholderia vietnamiensis G4]|uniref:Uncharacterized protein n=1 Tax=Burkholderia vietnamiensis (strain G4 / LMG 22486) TaxID=269482 RepID=A4JFG9_BURVG|nr:hypothetical protein Bcep1808_2020 [Burkholderia vietnamiensis G4]
MADCSRFDHAVSSILCAVLDSPSAPPIWRRIWLKRCDYRALRAMSGPKARRLLALGLAALGPPVRTAVPLGNWGPQHVKKMIYRAARMR